MSDAHLAKSPFRWVVNIGLVLLLIVGGGLGWVLISNPKHSLDRSHYRQLQLGMSEGEVHSILGGPPSNATTGIVLMELISDELGNPDDSRACKSQVWATDQGQITVMIDPKGVLHSKRYFVPNDNWTAKINGWLDR